MASTQAPANVRLLLVEDETKLARSLVDRLAREGYSVDTAFDGVQGWNKAASHEYGLIILDLNLPRKSGLSILNELRRHSNNTPVLILSGRQNVSDRVGGLRSGADDYLVKPFDSSELVARIGALLRRSGNEIPTVLTCADLSLDIVQHKVRRGGREIPLAGRQLALLEFFLRNQNEILTRKRIAEQVWGYKFETGTNIVGVYISYLRKAVDEGYPKKLIHTVFRAGFIMRDDR
jgi:DNA-binding response OmpR family regulator